MANIIKYKKSNTSSTAIKSVRPVDVNCIYETQTLYDGSKMLIIKTYNPDSRYAGISQTIHFTKESETQLIEIFKRELNIQ